MLLMYVCTVVCICWAWKLKLWNASMISFAENLLYSCALSFCKDFCAVNWNYGMHQWSLCWKFVMDNCLHGTDSIQESDIFFPGICKFYGSIIVTIHYFLLKHTLSFILFSTAHTHTFFWNILFHSYRSPQYIHRTIHDNTSIFPIQNTLVDNTSFFFPSNFYLPLSKQIRQWSLR